MEDRAVQSACRRGPARAGLRARPSATFPGADGRLAFFAQVGCGRYAEGDPSCVAQSFSAIMTVAPAGGGLGTLARCPGAQCVGPIGRHPAWSPDGTLLAVEFQPDDQAGPPAIAILTARGALVRRIAAPGFYDAHPVAWLPGGREVAVMTGDRLFTVSAAGGPARAVAGLRGARAWSARGDVAIAHLRGIYVRPAGSGHGRLILRASTRHRYGTPDWAPDGRPLAVRRTDTATGLSTIVTVPRRGGRSRVVVRGPSTGCLVGEPVWSPTGTRIAFATTCLDETGDDAPSVYAVRADGTRLRRLFEPISLIGRLSGVQAYSSSALSWQAQP